jgi:hypothetical protein
MTDPTLLAAATQFLIEVQQRYPEYAKIHTSRMLNPKYARGPIAVIVICDFYVAFGSHNIYIVVDPIRFPQAHFCYDDPDCFDKLHKAVDDLLDSVST